MEAFLSSSATFVWTTVRFCWLLFFPLLPLTLPWSGVSQIPLGAVSGLLTDSFGLPSPGEVLILFGVIKLVCFPPPMTSLSSDWIDRKSSFCRPQCVLRSFGSHHCRIVLFHRRCEGLPDAYDHEIYLLVDVDFIIHVIMELRSTHCTMDSVVLRLLVLTATGDCCDWFFYWCHRWWWPQ